MSTTENGQPLGLGLGEGLGPLRPLLTADDERGHFAEWIATALPFGAGNNMAEHAAKTDAAWLGWMARAGLEAFRCNEVLQQERQSLAMMLRMCASRLRNHGHQDLGDKAVDLLIRFGLQGSPLRAEPQKLPILPPSTELEKLAEEAGMVNLLNHGAEGTRVAEAVAMRDAPLLTAAPKLEQALRELVELEDMRLRLRQLHEMGHGTDYENYHQRLPLAWAAARAVLEPTTADVAN